MKLKYKKIIILTTMSTMGIGLLTLSISQDRPRAEESMNPSAKQEAGLLDSKGDKSDVNTMAADIADDALAGSATPSPSPMPSPSPTPLPVYPIEKDGNPKISALFEDYYAAKNSCDIDKLKTMLSDPSKVETLDQLLSKTEYIEDYRNIKSYVKKGIEEGTYIVYVYHEIKFTSVNTPAPGLAKFYLITDKDGKLKIFSGEMDPELKAYFDDRNNDEDVQDLIKMTNKKSKDAKKKDEDLQNFWEDIDKMANNNQSNSKAQGDAE